MQIYKIGVKSRIGTLRILIGAAMKRPFTSTIVVD